MSCGNANSGAKPHQLRESFGSQVAWAMITRHRFQIDGLILAGGFVRHPAPWAVNLSAWCGLRIPIALIRTMLRGYARLARWRFRRHRLVGSKHKDSPARSQTVTPAARIEVRTLLRRPAS